MRHACHWKTFVTALLCLAGAADAADLETIDRAIGKLPAFSGEFQEYGLLVFGPDAAKRVWLVRDGGVLYVDRNGNGDLTEPQDRLEADPKSSKPEDGVFHFAVGDIVDGALLHKDLRVSWFKIDHLKDTDSDVRAALASNPRFRACSVAVDVDVPNLIGSGIDGRLPESAMAWDHRGLLQFAASPADAPIIHFGGPWEVTLAGTGERWRVGRTEEVYLVVGTPGIGAGSTADVAFAKLIPPAIVPKLQVTFPPASAGMPPVVKSYDLARRCCGVNLYGDVAVPEGIGTGKAKVEISMESWPGVFVAPTQHEVEIIVPKSGPASEPVSPRLASKLEHRHPDGSIAGIRFSPDGKRLIAGNYPGGVVHVWDLASGKRLATMEAGNELRASFNYFALTPDWQTMFAWEEGRGKFEKFQRDGKTLHRVEYGSLIRSWNVDTGELLRTYQHSPPRGIRMMYLAPTGKYFLTLDEVPGEFETSRPRALTLWDLATGEHRQVGDGNSGPGAFSSDGRLVAVAVPMEGDDNHTESIRIFAAPEWEEKCKITVSEGKPIRAHSAAFAAGDRILIGSVQVYDKPDDWRHFEAALKFWDVGSGKEILSIPSPAKDQGFAYVKVSPDDQTVVASTLARTSGGDERLIVVDLGQKTWKMIDVNPGALVQEPQFHPGGKWITVPTQVVPKEELRKREPDDLPQPRIHLIDLASGQILETLVAPQGFVTTLAFSPDGKTLATSGKGAVLLWDFSSPPQRIAGNKAAQ